METSNQLRDSEGRYNFKFERVCKCGHTCGVHTAERTADNGQPCLLEGCACMRFARARTQPTHAEGVAQLEREERML